MQGGTHYDAAMRRAALMNGDDDDEDAQSSSSWEVDDDGRSGDDEKPEVCMHNTCPLHLSRRQGLVKMRLMHPHHEHWTGHQGHQKVKP